jgi:hypothetical protein
VDVDAIEAVAPAEERKNSGDGSGGESPVLASGEEENAPWPMGDEAAFLSEARERGETVVPVAASASEELAVEKGALPSVDEMVARLPAEVRTTLDDLFRAKFTAVRRVPAKVLK